jgi:hypothetical protein
MAPQHPLHIVGYMRGPISPESQEEHAERTKYIVILPEEESRARVVLWCVIMEEERDGELSCPSHKEQHATDHHRQTQAHHHDGPVCRVTRRATGLS